MPNEIERIGEMLALLPLKKRYFCNTYSVEVYPL